MKLTFLPKTKLGKLSNWAMVYFLLSFGFVAVIRSILGGPDVTQTILNWLLLLILFSAGVAAFISLFGNLVAIVWREDRSIIGIIIFILSVPLCALVASFLLGSYMI